MYKYIKRPLDFIFALTALIVLFLPMIAVGVIIKIESKGPVIFKQKRIGRCGSEFYIYKFRTMRNDTPENMPTHLLENSESYITKTGAFLRKTSIDELPQLLNIIKGDMSVIGPRPALWNQYDLIAARKKHGADSCRPGLTGWAQVNGRDELEICVKAEFDGEYAENIGFLFDLKIFFLTVKAVFAADGVREGKAENDFQNEKNIGI